MCGIVGMISRNDVGVALIEGLKSLEYRGYDSSGFAVIKDNKFVVHKDSGRVAKIEPFLPETEGAKIGIAHTRWATHGQPNQNNAHPHLSQSGRFVIVHNGIIENYQVLRKFLINHGFEFKTETDSETIAHLIEHKYKNSTMQAVRDAIDRLEGTFGLLVLDREDPGRLIAARQGSPLVIGVGDNEYLAASDPSAIMQYTKQVVYLEDGEMAELTLTGYRTSTFSDVTVYREPTQIDWEIEAIEKGWL